MKKGFGAALRAAMDARGFASAAALARAADISQPQVSRLLKDQRTDIAARTYFALCVALGLPYDHFAEFVETHPPAGQPPGAPPDTTGTLYTNSGAGQPG